MAPRSLAVDSPRGLKFTTTRVPSSPGQFASLRDGTIDVAITGPDNVLLYATADRNPVSELLDIRTIDRGPGLTLVTHPPVTSADDYAERSIGVDVIRSGFALLLFTMLDRLGIPRSEVDGTILHAESRIGAFAAGMHPRSTSIDASPHNLERCWPFPQNSTPTSRTPVPEDDVTSWLHETDEAEVMAVLATANPVLGRTDNIMLHRDLGVTIADLQVFTAIRRGSGADAPPDER